MTDKKVEMNEGEFQELKASVKRIEIAIIGDPETGVEGLVRRVKNHDEMLKAIQRIGWGIIGVSSFITGILMIYKTFAK